MLGDMTRIRWGVLGCARIADQSVIPAIKASGNGMLQAVASRDAARAQACAAKHGAVTAHASYEALLADPQVDAVYLPLPTALHAPWALKAIAARKPVLVEKPFATSAAEAQQVLDAGRAAGVPVGEAYMYHFHPVTRRVVELVRQGAIGKPELVRATFGVEIKPGDFRWQADAGGGALADLGCYCAGIARLLIGEEPASVASRARFQDGVDATLTGLLSFPSGAQAFFGCSMATAFDCSYEVFGPAGRIRVDRGGMVTWPGEAFTIQVWDAAGQRTETIPAANHYQLMVEAFAAGLRGGPAYPITAAETLGNLRTLDALLADARAHH
jgi:predicted dehydrogenase